MTVPKQRNLAKQQVSSPDQIVMNFLAERKTEKQLRNAKKKSKIERLARKPELGMLVKQAFLRRQNFWLLMI